MTHVHSGSGRLEYDPKSAGMPSYVMQEEFSRYQGYWWQPVSPGIYFRFIHLTVSYITIFTFKAGYCMRNIFQSVCIFQ